MTTKRGEGNVLITPDIIAREYLMRLHDYPVIARLASFEYRQYFENAIGNRVTIKKPYQAKLSKGRELADDDINPMVDETVELSVTDRYKGALQWNDVEKTLDIDQFSERYLDTLIEQHGIQFDQDGGRAISHSGFMYSGTTGAGLTQDVVPDIRAYAIEMGIPLGMNSFGLMNPVDSAQVQKDLSGGKGQSGKFNEELVMTNIEEHFVGKLSGFRMWETNHIEDMEVLHAHDDLPQVRGANQRGDMLNTDSWGENNTKVMKKGQLFSIAGVDQCYPRSWNDDLSAKRSTGRTMTFTVMEDVTTDGAGQATIKISPAINDGQLTTTDSNGDNVSLKAFQNVTRVPPDDAAITIIGHAQPAAAAPAKTEAKFYRQNIFYHRAALHYVPVQLSSMTSAVEQYRQTDPQTNVSILATQFFDGRKMEEILRLDTLYGVKNIYPDLCIRHISTER